MWIHVDGEEGWGVEQTEHGRGTRNGIRSVKNKVKRKEKMLSLFYWMFLAHLSNIK